MERPVSMAYDLPWGLAFWSGMWALYYAECLSQCLAMATAAER